METSLTNKDYNEIKRFVTEFNKLDPKIQAKEKVEFDKAWRKIYFQYAVLCSHDNNWVEMNNFVKDYEDVTKFNIKKKLSKVVCDNQRDPNSNSHRVYNKAYHQQCIDAYENINEYRQVIGDKISKLDQKRFAIGKKVRLAALQDKLDNYEFLAQTYAPLKMRQDLKNEYVKTKTDRYNHEKIELYKLNEKYATMVLSSALKTCPAIACMNHTEDLATNAKDPDCNVLNDVFHRIRLRALGTTAQEERAKQYKQLTDGQTL